MNVGLRYLIAGARCNIGLKAGRYMFEAPEPGLQGRSDGYMEAPL